MEKMRPVHGVQIFLGRFYPQAKLWANDYLHKDADKEECEKEGLLYFKGRCFGIEKDKIIFMFFENVMTVEKNQRFKRYYVVLRSEAETDYIELD
jgi:hypothetical protein